MSLQNNFSDPFLDENYILIKLLGTGGFGRAYLAKSKKTQETVVIKDVELMHLDEKPRKYMEQEGFILQKLSHPNIVKCIDSRIINEKAYIIMEYADDGDLKLKIKEHQQSKIPIKVENILNWFIEICEAINYIHSKNIIHRDLKPNNIFLMKNNHIKLGDFGIARIFNANESVETQIGTQPYFSPQMVKGEPYDYKTDIWDLGVILYEMVNFKNPFEAKGMHGMLMNIVNGKINKIEKKSFPNELIDLIYKILKVDPLERPEIKDIVNTCREILEKIEKENKEKENKENDEKKNENDKEKKEIKNMINKIYDNGKYEGEMKNDKREGYGKFEYKNGDIYEGYWENDLRNGKGTLIYKCGNKYEGEWKNDFKEGQNSKFYYNNKNIYEGEFKKNLRYGKGKLIYNNGDIYEGEFKDNEMEGKGILKKENGDFYEGEWKNGEFDGKGKYKYKNGDIYEGEFEDGYKNGKGILIKANGEKTEGKWENDEFIN